MLQTFSFAALTVAHGRTTAPRIPLLHAARRKVAVVYVVSDLMSCAVKSVIDRTFKFDDIVQVHRYLESSGQFGKIVVTLS